MQAASPVFPAQASTADCGGAQRNIPPAAPAEAREFARRSAAFEASPADDVFDEDHTRQRGRG
jgi:hypothetical protein